MSNYLRNTYYDNTNLSAWGDINNSPIIVATKKIDVFGEESVLNDWVLKAIAREQENEKKGKVSPTFSSVAEMKEWYDNQDE